MCCAWWCFGPKSAEIFFCNKFCFLFGLGWMLEHLVICTKAYPWKAKFQFRTLGTPGVAWRIFVVRVHIMSDAIFVIFWKRHVSNILHSWKKMYTWVWCSKYYIVVLFWLCLKRNTVCSFAIQTWCNMLLLHHIYYLKNLLLDSSCFISCFRLLIRQS